jgi:hypothetical protein
MSERRSREPGGADKLTTAEYAKGVVTSEASEGSTERVIKERFE